MQKFLENTYLFDFYQSLLTQRQRELIIGYYFEDLSLSELATTYNISRQSIFDSIKKAEIKLLDYEDKLQLWNKFNKQNELLDKISGYINDNIKQDNSSNQLKILIEEFRNEM